jgi:hypothetical protein
MKRPSSKISKILIGLVALVLYQAVTNWPPVTIGALFQLPLETWILIGAVGLAWYIDKRLAWPAAFLATIWASLLILHGHAARLFEIYFGRPFDLKFDFWMSGNLVDLIFDTYHPAIAVVILAVVGLGVTGLIILFGILTILSGRLIARPIGLMLWFVVGGALTLLSLYTSDHFAKADSETTTIRSVVFSRELSQLFNYKAHQDAFDLLLAEEAYKRIRIPSDLTALDNKDVFIIFIESYGRAIWDAPSYREVMEPRFQEFENSLRDGGYSFASRFIASSAFGGGSWLAHSSLQSGIWIDNNVHWERLLQSEVTPLPAYFNEAGYATVSVMPAMDIGVEEWPEGDYFEFTRHLWMQEMDYDHHGYDWSPMPDQFVLLRFHEQFLTPDAPPTFAEFVMTSSHLPFSAIPPFHDGPWEYDSMMETIRTQPMQVFKENTYHEVPRDVEGYSAAITYSLRTVVDFLLHRYDREAVVVLLGDHQPVRIMAGTETNHVPLHIITRDASLTQRFVERGFAPGWFPDENQNTFFVNEFLPLFLELSSSPSGKEPK